MQRRDIVGPVAMMLRSKILCKLGGLKNRQMKRTDLELHGGGNQVAIQTAVSQPVMAPWVLFCCSQKLVF